MSPIYVPGRMVLSKSVSLQSYMWEFPAQHGLWSPPFLETALWLDAADSSTVTTVSGAVSQWNDKSGNGRNATQDTAGSRPAYQTSAQNGLNAVRFTASSSHFLTAGTTSTWNFLHNGTASSVFIVARVRDAGDNPNAAHAFLATGAGTGEIGYRIDYDDQSSVSRSDALQITISRGVSGSFACQSVDNDRITPGSYAIIGNYVDADNATASSRSLSRINGESEFGSNASTLSVNTSNSTRALNIGRSGFTTAQLYLTGDICEILIFNTQPSSADRQRIEGYLAHKWGLTANLPNDHPYKSTAPTI